MVLLSDDWVPPLLGLVAAVAGVFFLGAVMAQPAAAQAILQLGSFTFSDETALATQVMTVLDGAGVQYRPQFQSQGFELGGAHYIWFYYWPFNNPGETTLDVGLIADLWQRPDGVWALELANFDYANDKNVVFDDGSGDRATVKVSTTAFLDLVQG